MRRRPVLIKGGAVSRRDAFVAIVGSAAGFGGGVAAVRAGSPDSGAKTAVVAASGAGGQFRATADYACDGRHDEQEIQQAIHACGDGGIVLLSPGTFYISGPIPLTSMITLQGAGRSTVLTATGTWKAGDGSDPGGVIEVADGRTHRTALRHVTIDGGEANALCKGIYYNVDAYRSDQPTGPDPVHVIEDVHVLRTGSVGVHLTGGTNRDTRVTGVRIFQAGSRVPAEGILLECYDSFVNHCESGAASGDGFRVTGANNRFTACKSWYSQRNGFHVAGVRNQFAACESQDNARHGFYLPTGPNSLVACHADSNGRPSGGTGGALFDGFHLPFSEAVQCVGCQSYDRREEGDASQRYGFYVGHGSRDCQIIGIARHNRTGPTGGDGLASPGTMVSVTGTGGVLRPASSPAAAPQATNTPAGLDPEFEIDEAAQLLRVRVRDAAGAVRTAELPLR